MNELGRLKIDSGKSLARARIKARQALCRLGYSEITVTRMEAALADISRLAVGSGQEIVLSISIAEMGKRQGIVFSIEPVPEQIKYSAAANVYDSAEISISESGNARLLLFRRFGDGMPKPDGSLIEQIREAIAHPTREELTEEISRKNEELSKSQQLLNAILENIGSAVYAKDVDGRYIYVNHVWETETGCKREEVLGLRTMDIISGERGEKYVQEDMQVLKTGKIMRFEDQLTNGEGNATYYLKTGVPMLSDGQIVGVCCLTTDITDRKQMEEELISAKIVAEDAAKSKADFMANMSHEIRTPMNVIVGMTFLLNNTQLNTKQRDYAGKIQRSSQHLLGIINDILDFSKIEVGKLNIEQTDFRLHVLLENLYNMIGEKCYEKNLELIFDIDPDISDGLCGDPLRLGQVLVNYTNNAVKFTETGEIVVRIRKIAHDGDMCTLRFEVQDSGIGLTQEQKALLFQPFQQADTSTTRKYGGTGLGLVISKQLVALMGGDVGVESTYGVGSVFWFTVHLRERKKNRNRMQCNISIKGRRVLVVDDNAITRKVFSEILNTLTLRANEAENGDTAIRMVKEADKLNDPYEVIYMDMQMPHMNGIETWKKILALKLSHTPKCMIVTAYGHEEVFYEAEKANLDQVLIKPITPSTLLEATYQILGGSIIYRESKPGDEKQKAFSSLNSLQNIRILLVEDNELNQQVAIELLDRNGIQIDVAENGQIAVDMVMHKPYDAVLMDMQMPVMDGFEATNLIRERPEFSDLPIIAMTANAMMEDKERCINAGMNDYVTKPIEPEQLFSALRKWTGMSHKDDRKSHKQEWQPEAKRKADKQKDPNDGINGIEIPDLNTKLGLDHILGKKDAYIKILRKFSVTQKNAITDIEDALDKKDIITAKRIAHTLKALAGNIGAESLAEKAAALELIIKERLPKKALQTALNETRSMLCFLINELERTLPPEPAANSPSGPETASEQLKAVLLELKPYIQSRKPKRCAEMMEKLRKMVWPERLRADAVSLDTLISKYQYREAMDILDSLTHSLEGDE